MSDQDHPADEDEDEDAIEVSDLEVDEEEQTSITGGMLANPTAGGEVRR